MWPSEDWLSPRTARGGPRCSTRLSAWLARSLDDGVGVPAVRFCGPRSENAREIRRRSW